MVEGPKLVGEALDAGAEPSRPVRGRPAAPRRPGRRPGPGRRRPGVRPGARRARAGGRHGHAAAGPGRRPVRRRRRSPTLRDADLVVVCVDVRDPGNLGTVLRSAEAAGVGGVICCDGSVDVYNPKSVRASAGSLFHVRVVAGGEPVEVLATLGGWGLRRLGDAARRAARPTTRSTSPAHRPRARQRGPRPAGAGRGRLVDELGDHPDGRAGGVAQRRHGRRRPVLRGGPPARHDRPRSGRSHAGRRCDLDRLPDAVLECDADRRVRGGQRRRRRADRATPPTSWSAATSATLLEPRGADGERLLRRRLAPVGPPAVGRPHPRAGGPAAGRRRAPRCGSRVTGRYERDGDGRLTGRGARAARRRPPAARPSPRASRSSPPSATSCARRSRR